MVILLFFYRQVCSTDILLHNSSNLSGFITWSRTEHFIYSWKTWSWNCVGETMLSCGRGTLHTLIRRIHTLIRRI